jgi:hypothetical protein
VYPNVAGWIVIVCEHGFQNWQAKRVHGNVASSEAFGYLHYATRDNGSGFLLRAIAKYEWFLTVKIDFLLPPPFCAQCHAVVALFHSVDWSSFVNGVRFPLTKLKAIFVLPDDHCHWL